MKDISGYANLNKFMTIKLELGMFLVVLTLLFICFDQLVTYGYKIKNFWLLSTHHINVLIDLLMLIFKI